MLKKPADELHRGKRHSAESAGIRFPIPESDRCISEVFYAVVGDGDTVDIWGEILQCRFSVAYRLGMDNPWLFPDSLIDRVEEAELFKLVPDLGSKDY
ncbi:MAG: hypothetical protein P4L55_14970 [Syntrophobacteraceae bacterium]|nr:hypothetical protein [Syntrophobacteraceae bacterium]